MPRNDGIADGQIQVRAAQGAPERRIIVGEATLGLMQYLQQHEGFDLEGIQRLQEEAINVLSGCLEVARAGQKTGLVCGYVQSGKTASIETVSALGRDNGYRLIVLLAGVTTNLVDQSSERMNHLRRGAGGYAWVMWNNPTIRNRAELENLVNEWRASRAEEVPHSRTLFVTVMKQVNHLQNLAALLGTVPLRNVPAIVFDDEADQASLNTRPLDPNPSPIYTRIRQLRAVVPSHTLLQYTATRNVSMGLRHLVVEISEQRGCRGSAHGRSPRVAVVAD